jgi:hypothetical protein
MTRRDHNFDTDSGGSWRRSMTAAVRFAVEAAVIGSVFAVAGTAAAQSVQISGNAFPTAPVGQGTAQTVTLTAQVDDVVIQNLSITSAGGNAEYVITDYGTCNAGAHVAAGTSCTFTVTFYPQAAGYAQAPAPIGRWAKVNLEYTDQVSGGLVFPNYPLTGTASLPNQVITPGLISDIVGNDAMPQTGFGGDGGPASGAIFAQPSSIAMDTYGNLYITESGNDVVRVVYRGGNVPGISNPVAGDIYTIAGIAPSGGISHPGHGIDSVPATSAPLNNPIGVAVDSLANIYIVDSVNNAIRKITNNTGYISTIAGTLNAPIGYTGDGGPATGALLANPSGISVDGFGNIFIADNGNNAVRVVYGGGVALANLIALENPGTTATVGAIYTIAGGPNAAQPLNGDGGLATQANLNAPNAVVVDSAGDVYIADYSNQAVRRVDAVTGNISSIASGIDNPVSLSVDSSDSIYFNGHSTCLVSQYNPSLQTGLSTPFISTVAGNGTCIASGDGGSAINAGLSGAAGVVVDGLGNLYLLEADGVRFVNGQQGSIDFGNTDISIGAEIVAQVTDDNILPAPGTGSVVDFSNTPFSVVNANPQYFSVIPIPRLNPNLYDCDFMPFTHPYLSPGQSCGVQVYFQPTVDGGPFYGDAYQYLTSTPANILLSGSGIGTLPTATLTGTPTTFVTELNESTSPPQSFTLTNTSNSILSISGIGISPQSGSANGYFSESDTCGPAVNSRYVLNPGTSCQITVAFTGTATGTVTGMLQVTDNASSGGGIQTLALNGIVVAPLGEFVDATGTNVLTSTSSPQTTPGSTSSFNVNLTNAGTAILTIQPSSWAISGTNEKSFTIAVNTCGATLAAGATCTLTINFAPAPLTYGNYIANLSVQDDSGGQPLNNGSHTYIQQILTLIGLTGNAPQQTSSFSLQNGNFPSVELGTSVTKTVTLVLNDASNVLSITTAAGSEYTVGTYSPCSGPAGTTCAVPITFTPKGIGPRPGTLIVGNLESSVAVPYFLPMTGYGAGTLASLTPGIITTVVGGVAGQSVGVVGANGPATLAQVGSLSDLAIDLAGGMFLADQQNEVIWKVDTTGQIYLYAGVPFPVGDLFQRHMYGDGGLALNSYLAYLGPIALDARGGLYLGDYDYSAYGDPARIRYIDPFTHAINTVAGYIQPFLWQPTSQYFSGNSVKIVVNGTPYLYLAVPGGESGTVPPVWPTGFGSSVTDGTVTWVNEGVYTATNGCASQTDTFGDGCPAQDITVDVARGLIVDTQGDLYFSDLSGVRRIDATTGIVTRIAGNGTFGYSPDGTPATQAALQATQLAFDSKGTLYFIDAQLYVRKIDPATGALNTITGNPVTTNSSACGAAPGEGGSAAGVGYSYLSSIAFDAADNLYLTDSNACVVRRIDAATQTIHTVAGLPGSGFPSPNTGYGDLGQASSDGSALEAELSEPFIVKLDSLANIYIGSGYGGVRKVDVSRSVMPFAGLFGQQNYTQVPFTVSAPMTATVLNAGNSGSLQFGSPFLSPSWGITQNYFIRDITDPTGSLDCYDLELIAPGAECPISIDFAPQFSSTSLVDAQDIVADNAPTSPQLILMSGLGIGSTPAVTLTPKLVSVFTAQGGTSTPQTVTLTNNTTAPISVGGINISGPGAGSFSQTNNCGSQLPPMSSCAVQVTFNAPTTNGTSPIPQKSTLNVPESADSAPQTAQLIGIGTTPSLPSLTINETIQVVDQMPTAQPSQLLAISDIVHIADAMPGAQLSPLLAISDTVHVSEGMPSETPSPLLSISETVHIADGLPAITPSGLLAVAETVHISDAINATMPLLPTQATLQFLSEIANGKKDLVVTVTPSAATGTVELYDGTSPIASGPLSGGIFTYQSGGFSPGIHQFHAQYDGSSTYASSITNTVSVTVQTALTVTALDQVRAFAAPEPPLTYQITGFVNGDTAAVLRGSPFLSTKASLNSQSGTYAIVPTQDTLTGPAYYTFTFVDGTLTITGNHPQSIYFLPFPTAISLSVKTLTLTGTTSSALPITYQVSGPATLSGTTLTLTGPGTVTVTATQSGSPTFSPATSVAQTFIVVTP